MRAQLPEMASLPREVAFRQGETGWESAWRFPSDFAPHRLFEALRKGGYEVSDASRFRLVSVYFDAPHGVLFRSGIRCRSVTPGKRLLVEYDPSATPRDRAVSRQHVHEGTIRDLIDDQSLVPLLKVGELGEERRLTTPGGTTALFVVSRARFALPEGRSRLSPGLKVRVSGSGPGDPEIRHLSVSLRGRFLGEPFKSDPLSEGLEYLHAPLPGAPYPEHLAVRSGDSRGQLVLKTLARQAFRIRANLRGALLDLHPEFVHDVRVATRRARAALRLFGDMLSPESVSTLKEGLAWIAEGCGSVRDLDVLKTHLAEEFDRDGTSWEGARFVLERLESQRLSALEEMRVRLSGPVFKNIMYVIENTELINNCSVGLADSASLAYRYIEKSLRRVLRTRISASEIPQPEDLHRLRIRLKRLRYTVEFFQDVAGDSCSEIVREFAAVQDCLGIVQDSRVAEAILHRTAQEVASSCREGEWLDQLLQIGALIRLERERCKEMQARFSSLWRGFPGKVRAFIRLADRGGDTS